MKARKPIEIVGGGLAGLTLGIGLRQRGVPVTVYEAGIYPRHRVCGEFINGRGLTALQRLGLRETLVAAGAIEAQTARFVIQRHASPVRALPQPALCLSRYHLDQALAGVLVSAGGEVKTRTRRAESLDQEGMVRASGRQVRVAEKGWRWFGLKVHAVGVPLTADLEMHAQPNGYIGVCRLAGDEVNICGVFRRRVEGIEQRLDWEQVLRGEAGSALRERLAEAVFLKETFCSVAGLMLQPQRASHHRECCVGDAITMIPPVTGNGMSMAFESAEAAIEPLARYSAGEEGWQTTRAEVARRCDLAFGSRLRWARVLQWLMFTPWSRGRFGEALLKSETAWHWLFRRTR